MYFPVCRTNFWFVQPAIASFSGLVLSSLTALFPSSAIAQTTATPSCQPPSAGEYLLLVVTPDPQADAVLQQALPPTVRAQNCDYLGTRVARMGGFQTVADASTWSKYITEAAGLQAFVAHPAGSSSGQQAAAQPTTQPEAAPAPAATTSAAITQPTASSPPAAAAQPTTPEPTQPVAAATPSFEARPLGAGYAVLVNYFNQPNVALQVKQLLPGQPVGLVSYAQRPYLLALQTTNRTMATAALQRLAERGFQVLLVNSQSAVLLTPEVAN